MPGIKDISKMTGLSSATISRVFNNSLLVSPKTREIVLNAAKKINYRPNQIAKALRSGHSMTIGVIVPEINNFFFADVINSIENALTEKGYSLIIVQSHESFETEKIAINSLMKLNVDGILISCSKDTTDYSIFEDIQSEGVPIVFFDRKPGLRKCNSVLLDDYEGGFMATKHLIENGCTTLMHVTDNADVSIFNERKDGFYAAVKQFDTQVSNHYAIRLSFDLEKDMMLLSDLLKTKTDINGIFCHGDRYAIHVLNILRLLDYNVPEEVQLIGFGNNDYTRFSHPKLSTIDQSCEQMGGIAVELLLNNLKDTDNTYSNKVLSPNLIVRDSSSRR